MKLASELKSLMAGALAATLLAGRLAAQDTEAGPAADAKGAEGAKAAGTTEKAPEAMPMAKAPLSPGVAEVIKLLDAGVSKDVIKAYVESSSTAFSPTAADVIALKEHGVTDDLTMAMLKRGAEVKTQAATAAAPAAASGPITTTAELRVASPSGAESGYVSDPMGMDSYAFFQKYYLMPRTLANVNETMGYNAVGYSFGFYPQPFGLYFGPGIVAPRRSVYRGVPFQSVPRH